MYVCVYACLLMYVLQYAQQGSWKMALRTKRPSSVISLFLTFLSFSLCLPLSPPHACLQTLVIISLLEWGYLRRRKKEEWWCIHRTMKNPLCGGGKKWNFIQPVLSQYSMFQKGCGKFTVSWMLCLCLFSCQMCSTWSGWWHFIYFYISKWCWMYSYLWLGWHIYAVQGWIMYEQPTLSKRDSGQGHY